MVVGVHLLLALAQLFVGQGGDHLVDIHIGAGAGARLKNIDRELIRMLTGDNLVGGFSDRRGDILIQ